MAVDRRLLQRQLPSCRFILLCELEEFTSLRRGVGVARARLLIDDVATRITAAIPELRASAAGANLLELTFDCASFAAGTAIVDRIRDTMTVPFDLDGESYRLSLRIGGIGVPVAEADDVRMIEAAEQALVDARHIQADVVRDLVDPAAGDDPIQLMRELPGAIASGQIFLQYQPKVRVRQQQVVSAEALVRWRHPERGLILPGAFIEAAERSNIIGALTLWIIRRGIADQRMLAAQGHDIPIFINISGMLLSDAGFVRDACALVAAGGARIGFEITETAVIRDPESAIANLRTFAEIGVPLAIDDYGAGLSSLAYLKRLPASELKIDKLFVTQLTSSNRDPLIVRSTIDLAHALDMEVTAEGVETPAALALLGVMGCDMVQGFLISRPVEFAAFQTYLAEDRHLAAMVSPRMTFLRNERQWKTA
ncbi:EAL domain-containing protein [Sphingomonas sp. 2R-10]|uniref:EAL domain-containing protein n=1 Tax=Sphingomonas sp. 2R-10 TaxID=3045148 RepID=UPI0013DD9AC6|nr:EAL domain-containing protein [Sphingomonas sp. 2R-10]MDJ0275640.1 EAL domain-containing protein [Sphingomonas sp. 2R-10]